MFVPPYRTSRTAAHRTISFAAAAPQPLAGTVRGALRQLWREAGAPWDTIPAHHSPRNVAIARDFIATDEAETVIGARYGISRVRASVIAHNVVYGTLGLRSRH